MSPRLLFRALRRFGPARQASIAPFLGLTFVVLVCCIGLAIDVGRAVLVQARLSAALDAAGLAVGARLSTADFDKDAKNFVAANFKPGYSAATVTEVTATPNAAKTVVSLTATATMPTVFMQLLGNDSVTVKAASEVTRASPGLEIALVLDNTGSMQQSNSMPTLKASANDLLDILFGTGSSLQNLYVSLVPFSQTVNVGAARSSWMTGSAPANWGGCVLARTDGKDQTEDPPESAATKFEYYASTDGSDPNTGCPMEVTPLTNSKATLTSAIEAMTARGNTHINLGAVWGWRTLSKDWRGLWGDAKLPLDYNSKNMSKAIVLMTDGANTMSEKIYTAYGKLSEGRLGTTDRDAAEAELDKRLAAVCANMKSKGVIVYTVAFAMKEKDTKSLLQNCATSAANFFDAGDKPALQAAFRSIGDSLSNLRVSR